MKEMYSICDNQAMVIKVFDTYKDMFEYITNNYTKEEWQESQLTADKYLDDNGYYAECLEEYEIF